MSKVMVVDDSPDLRYLMTILLKSENYEVSTASDGQEALDLCASEGLPDMIFLDYTMGVMSGPEFIEENARLRPNWNVPIIMMTGHSLSGLPDYKCTETLLKPVDISHIVVLTKRYIGRFVNPSFRVNQ